MALETSQGRGVKSPQDLSVVQRTACLLINAWPPLSITRPPASPTGLLFPFSSEPSFRKKQSHFPPHSSPLTRTALPEDAGTSLWTNPVGPPAELIGLLATSGPADLAPFLQPSLPLASVTISLWIPGARAPLLPLTAWALVLPMLLSQRFSLSPHSLYIFGFSCLFYPGDFQTCIFSSGHSLELQSHFHNQLLDLSPCSFPEPLELHFTWTELAPPPLYDSPPGSLHMAVSVLH